MQPGNLRVTELLNDALIYGLNVTNSYFLHAHALGTWGLSQLRSSFCDVSIEEMREDDDLLNRILPVDGPPERTAA